MAALHVPLTHPACGSALAAGNAWEAATAQSIKAQLFDAAETGLCLLVAGQPRLINACFARLLGGTEADTQLSPTALMARWPAVWPQLIALDSTERLVSCPQPHGSSIEYRARAWPLTAQMGKASPWGAQAQLVTLSAQPLQQRQAFSADWHARMLEQTETMCRSGSAEVHFDTGVAVVSKGLQALVGDTLPTGLLPSKRLLRWLPAQERGYAASIWQGAIPHEPFEFQHRLVRADGTRLEVLQRGVVETGPHGERHGYLIVQDITAQREAEQRIQELANHDEVTGLANRAQLLDRIDAAVHSAKWDPRAFVLLSIQVDSIEQLKEAMGYGAGDAMAMAVAARLCAVAQPEDIVARLDGGEFALLRHPDHCTLDPTGSVCAHAIVQALSNAEKLGTVEIVPRAEVGVARFPTDADTAGLLLEAAQTARMALGQSAGQHVSAVAFFTPETRAAALRTLAIESGLRHAVEKGELYLQYQLQVDLGSGEVLGAEVLPGWNSHELGPVEPAEFLPVARHTGLIVMLGHWQREAACAQLKVWQQAGIKPLRLALNVSSLELQQPDMVEHIRQALHTYGLPPEALGLEVSEQILVTGSSDMVRKLQALRTMGIEISLDDFGSGYSHLSLLRSLPVDVIKVHRSCVPDVTAATGDVSLTRAIINMAHSLHIKVLAEGVETAGQLTLLVANGCDRMQGNIFSAVVNANTLAQLCAEHIRLPEQFMKRQRERTLLLVDDEPSIVAALKRLFRRDGYRIVTAHSGAEGLQRMAEYDVDVVLSDQRMPGMTGVEFLRSAKELYPDTVRMVLSGYTELQSITDAINEGSIYRFLTKPWDDERLRLHVQEAFRQKGMADENKRLASEVVAANDALAQVNTRLETVLHNQQDQIHRETTRADTARDMVDLLPLPLIGLDPDGIVVLVNQAAQQCAGAQLLLGEPLPALHTAPDSRLSHITLSGKHWVVQKFDLNSPQARGHLLLLTPSNPQHPTGEPTP
jgi:diguanylate cyclase (GGDEF)-like protein